MWFSEKWSPGSWLATQIWYSPILYFRKMASEVEETLKRLVSHKGVIGTIVVNNEGVRRKCVRLIWDLNHSFKRFRSNQPLTMPPRSNTAACSTTSSTRLRQWLHYLETKISMPLSFQKTHFKIIQLSKPCRPGKDNVQGVGPNQWSDFPQN